jgi:hypothetical protein
MGFDAFGPPTSIGTIIVVIPSAPVVVEETAVCDVSLPMIRMPRTGVNGSAKERL